MALDDPRNAGDWHDKTATALLRDLVGIGYDALVVAEATLAEVQATLALLDAILAELESVSSGAVASVLTLQAQGVPSMSPISIDSTDSTLVVRFVDDHGDAASAPANLGLVTFTSSDETVATIAADATNPLQGNISPVAVGGPVTFDVAPFIDTSGNPLTLADGVTPFPTPGAVTDTVVGGVAAAADLTLNNG